MKILCQALQSYRKGKFHTICPRERAPHLTEPFGTQYLNPEKMRNTTREIISLYVNRLLKKQGIIGDYSILPSPFFRVTTN